MEAMISKLRRVSLAALLILVFNSCLPQGNSAGDFISTLESARRLSTQKNWKDAARLWKDLTLKNPVNGDYWANLGNASYNLADYSTAIEAYKHQIDLGYGLVHNAAYNIACCYALQKETEPALDWLEK